MTEIKQKKEFWNAGSVGSSTFTLLYTYSTRPASNITCFKSIHCCRDRGGEAVNWHGARKQSDHYINNERKIACLLMVAIAKQTIQSGSEFLLRLGGVGRRAKFIFYNHGFFCVISCAKMARGKRKAPKCISLTPRVTLKQMELDTTSLFNCENVHALAGQGMFHS